MKIIRPNETSPEELDALARESIYNGLDCMVTLEVFEAMHPQLDNMTANTYAFSRDLQGPTMEMKLRGMLVDQSRRLEVIDEFYAVQDTLQENLERIAAEAFGMFEFNWRSGPNVKELLYERLGIPPARRGGSISVDRAARDRLQQYIVARPILNHLNALSDLGKKIAVLKTAIDPDGRIRTSYNIAGTSTGRFSSSVSEFGTGGNLQNVEEGLRSVFISDPGMKFAKFDAKSGESYAVGGIEWNLFGDGRYLDACESGDLHTASAKLCWPMLSWSGNLKHDKQIAERLFYRHHSYRQTTKKLGHASNYGGQPYTIAAQTGMPIDLVKEFQPTYFEAYPAHRRWHAEVKEELVKKGYLISLMGRKRWFLGRRTDDSTLREAIAYDPQGSLADIVNQGMLKVWRANIIQLMMQDHDAITVQYPEEQEDEIIPKVLELLAVPVQLSRGRTMTIPYDCKVGWNRADYDEARNPAGLKDYAGTDTRRRPQKTSILDRGVRFVHG